MFLPRDTMHKRGLCRLAVFVRPYVTFVHSAETNEHIFIFFHRRVTTPFKFFHTKRYDNLPPGTPLYGGVKCSVVDKNRDSRPDSRFIACCQRCDRQVLSTRWHRTVASW